MPVFQAEAMSFKENRVHGCHFGIKLSKWCPNGLEELMYLQHVGHFLQGNKVLINLDKRFMKKKASIRNVIPILGLEQARQRKLK